jgi:hypothetical protein
MYDLLPFNTFSVDDYTSWLVETNKRQEQTTSLLPNFTTYAFGLAEEIYEATNACDYSSYAALNLEIGDCIAYTTLLLSLFNATSLLASVCSNPRSTLAEDIGTYFGLLKRHHRGDFNLFNSSTRQAEFINSILNLLGQMLFLSNCSLQELTWLNHEKLTNRLNSTTTFKGSGDR